MVLCLIIRAMVFKGILAVVISSIAYGFLPVFIKIAIHEGMRTDSIVFFRFIFASLVSVLLCISTRQKLLLKRKQFFLLLFFGILGFGMTAFLVAAAYRVMPIGIATMLHFCYPIFVSICMVLFFKEKITLLRVFALISVMCGLMLMVKFDGTISLLGTLLALASGITYASYILAIKKTALSDLGVMSTIFYVTFFSACFFGVRALASNSFAFPPNITGTLATLAAGVICTVLSLGLLTWGVKQIGATSASVVNMIEPMTSIIAGIILFNEEFTAKILGGCLIIVFGVVLISLPQKSKRGQQTVAKVIKCT